MEKYLIQNSIWWIETLSLGGIRQDTYPYGDKNFMSKWAGQIMNEFPKFWIEVTRNCTSEKEQRLEIASGKSVSDQYTWIENRKAELAVQEFLKDPDNEGKDAPPMTDFLPERNSSSLKEVAKQEFSSDVIQRLGGATTLKGAEYFWFFTQVMLGTAFLFMAVAYFYQPRTFIQGDEEDSESSSEAA